MSSYSSSITQTYRSGYIHSAVIDGHEIIRAQVDSYAYPMQFKSIRAAKIAITKHLKSGRALSKRGAL